MENKDQFGLTEKGKKDMQIQAKKWKNFDLIITSPFRRAKESAMFFSKTSQCKIIENTLLREVDFGDFELCKYELSDDFFEKHKDDSIPFPNGESLLDAKKRSITFIKEINNAYKNKKILIVTHGWIALFLREQLDKTFNLKKAIEDYDDNNSREVIEVMNFPNFTITSEKIISKQFRNLGITNFHSACKYIQKLQYKRTSNKSDLLLVLKEKCGTCSSKHAVLAKILEENSFDGIKLTIGIYKMTPQNTPGVQKVFPDNIIYIPEAHVYLRHKGIRLDFTRNNSEALKEEDLLEEIEITVDEMIKNKENIQKNF